MRKTDVIVIGGGIAGLSAAARFALRADTVVLERESALGYHSSGRSATFYHFGIGNAPVRGLTSASHEFFADPPAGFSDLPLWEARPALFIATDEMKADLAALEKEMRRYTDSISSITPREMVDIVPVLKIGEGGIVDGLIDTGGRKLDADLLLQSYARAVRRAGGEVITNAPVNKISRSDGRWIVDTQSEQFSAEVVVNAGGAWADELAVMAGVKPLGLQPLRRTIIAFDPPSAMDTAGWPFTKTASDDGFYILPDAGRLLASPMDVTPSLPTDAQAEDYDVALAAWRVEEATTLKVGRISHRWAGLRSFVADKVPTAGFALDVPNFFWLAGQGGYGLQTAPAMALAAEALMFDLPWPEALRAKGVESRHLNPDRLRG
jgi:D-arginine dehydrogenase